MKPLLKVSVLLLLSLVLLPSCSQKTGENSGSGSASQSVQSVAEPVYTADSKADAEEAVIWPQQKMGDLPEPAGTVISVTDNDSGVSVAVEEMDAVGAADYVQKLKDLGYSPMAEGEDENGGIIFSAARDNITVVFIFDPSGGPLPDTSLCQISIEKNP